MGAIQKLGALLGYEPRGASAYVQLIDPSTGVIQTFNEFAVAPSIQGNELMRVLQMIFDADSHLEGLYRRISIALLSSKIQITCDDKAVEQYVKDQLGLIEGAPPTRFLRFMNELTSSLQYGFSLHQKSLVNEDDGSHIRLRRVEPVDVYEFTVDGDDLVSVAEGYSENVHGGNVARRKIRNSVDGKDVDVVDILAADLLHIAPLQLGRNYWGRSIFRSAIGTSSYKVIYMYCDAIRQGRFSVPWLIGKLDKFDQRSSEDVSVLSKVMKMPATAIDRMLLFRKEDEIQAISPAGGTDILESVRYIDFSNSKLVLEQFVDVGDKAWGSRSTYSGGSDDFQDSLNFYEMAIIAGAHELSTAIAIANFVDPPPMRVYFKEMGAGEVAYARALARDGLRQGRPTRQGRRAVHTRPERVSRVRRAGIGGRP